ncbi:conserved hypothetical protein [Staphylothermus marinus F1]|uniref:TRASH domain-containing protein n=1 Tax=Staphylothermus marinus (strain ATCC 43588 / DSM 3639 / JCM 9404 / F1) TaxID=399550 RepID=A3DN61_STAMF|nr:hypothetical protein [Staphylothermus marinus]ABN70071.1 conserved hypothetical protein [Staphylothermus marinus F1]
MFSVPKKKYNCIVCGRVFPEGQGIIIEYDGLLLTFHSNRCASKFFRELLERVPPDELKDYIKRLVSEYNERLEAFRKLRSKKI